MIDAKLLNRVLQKDTTAYEDLFNQIYPDAYRLAFSFTKNAQDAEDAVQDAMIKIFKKIDTLKNVNSFKSWSNTIIVNSAKDVCKKKNKNPYNFSDYDDYDNLDFEEAKEEEDTEFNPEDIADKHELISVIDEIMSNLTEDQKICLQLRYYNDLQIKDIAKALDIPENTVKTRISRGRRKFELIAKEYEKKGFSLFGVSAIPFFFDKSFKNLTIPAMSYSKVIAPALATSAAVGATATGTTIGGAVVGKSAAVTGKVVAISTIKKVIAGIAITGIIAGGTEAAITIVNQKRSIPVSITETTERTIESTTDRIKNQSQSTTENDNYANKSYIYYPDTKNRAIIKLNCNTNKKSIYIENIISYQLSMYKNYLFYVNEESGCIYKVNTSDEKPNPQIISEKKLASQDMDGHSDNYIHMLLLNDNIIYVANDDGWYPASIETSVYKYNITDGTTTKVFTNGGDCYIGTGPIFYTKTGDIATIDGYIEPLYTTYDQEGNKLSEMSEDQFLGSDKTIFESKDYLIYCKTIVNNTDDHGAKHYYLVNKNTNEKKKCEAMYYQPEYIYNDKIIVKVTTYDEDDYGPIINTDIKIMQWSDFDDAK